MGAEDGQGEHDGRSLTRREWLGVLFASAVIGFVTGPWNVWGV